MDSINDGAKEVFRAWAAKNEDKNIFPGICVCDSYYSARDSETTYIVEYSFNTMAELKHVMEAYGIFSDRSHILDILVMEVCQNQYDNKLIQQVIENEKEIHDEKSKEIGLPEFIYIF